MELIKNPFIFFPFACFLMALIVVGVFIADGFSKLSGKEQEIQDVVLAISDVYQNNNSEDVVRIFCARGHEIAPFSVSQYTAFEVPAEDIPEELHGRYINEKVTFTFRVIDNNKWPLAILDITKFQVLNT